MTVNSWFLISLLLLMSVAIGILLLPLLRPVRSIRHNDPDTNIAIARQQLQELKQQLQRGELNQAEYDLYYQELQTALADNLNAKADDVQLQHRGRWMALLVLILVPAISLPLYALLGEPKALEKQSESRPVNEISQLIPGLIERLKQNPNDVKGWMMLGRSYMSIEDFQKAMLVFAKLYSMQPDNPDVLLNYASSIAMNNQGRLLGEPTDLINKALQITPNNPEALWLAGLMKLEAGDKTAAINYWQTLLQQLPADSAGLPQVQAMIAEVSAEPAKPAGRSNQSQITVAVSLDPALGSRVSPDQIVFIYAQALSGPKMPLAIVRKSVQDLPLTITLDDSMAMQPNLHLADFKQVKIIARISKSGNASSQKGDLIGSQDITVSNTDQPVSVLINQSVD